MTDVAALAGFLAGASVAPDVFALRPDYRVLLLAVDGLVPGPSDEASDAASGAGRGRGPGRARGPAR